MTKIPSEFHGTRLLTKPVCINLFLKLVKGINLNSHIYNQGFKNPNRDSRRFLSTRRSVRLEAVRGVRLEAVRGVRLEAVRGVRLEAVRGVSLEACIIYIYNTEKQTHTKNTPRKY